MDLGLVSVGQQILSVWLGTKNMFFNRIRMTEAEPEENRRGTKGNRIPVMTRAIHCEHSLINRFHVNWFAHVALNHFLSSLLQNFEKNVDSREAEGFCSL